MRDWQWEVVVVAVVVVVVVVDDAEMRTRCLFGVGHREREAGQELIRPGVSGGRAGRRLGINEQYLDGKGTYNYVHGGWDKARRQRRTKSTEGKKIGWGLFIGIRHCLLEDLDRDLGGGKSVAAAQR
jgi:hypothetical protein